MELGLVNQESETSAVYGRINIYFSLCNAVAKFGIDYGGSVCPCRSHSFIVPVS